MDNKIKTRVDLSRMNEAVYRWLARNRPDLLDKYLPALDSTGEAKKALIGMMSLGKPKPLLSGSIMDKYYADVFTTAITDKKHDKDFLKQCILLAPDWLHRTCRSKLVLEEVFYKKGRLPDINSKWRLVHTNAFNKNSKNYDSNWAQNMLGKYKFMGVPLIFIKIKQNMHKDIFFDFNQEYKPGKTEYEWEHKTYGKFRRTADRMFSIWKTGLSGYPKEVLMGIRAAKAEKDKLPKFDPLKVSYDNLINRMPPHLRLKDDQIWEGSSHKYSFIDSIFGEFIARASSVGPKSGHPQRRIDKVKSAICREVKCVETEIVYSTVTIATAAAGVGIHAALKDPKKTAGGYRWAYCDEDGNIIK